MASLYKLSLFLNGFTFIYNGLLLLTNGTSVRGATFFLCLINGMVVLLLLKAKEWTDV